MANQCSGHVFAIVQATNGNILTWRCSDCSAIGSLTEPVVAYLDAHPAETLERDLKEWGNAKGVRAAYKMLKSARFKCLITLNRRRQTSPPG